HPVITRASRVLGREVRLRPRGRDTGMRSGSPLRSLTQSISPPFHSAHSGARSLRSHAPARATVDPVIVVKASELRDAIREVFSEFEAPQPSPSATTPKKWLTQKECREYLGVSKPTLARYRAEGKLPYSK